MARNKFDVDETLESPFQWKHLKRAFQYIGRHRFQMIGALALSVLATVPLLIFKRQILFTFGCSELLWDYAQAYFTTYVSGTVFALLSY